ncbi:MAG: sn-glycerol-1-phosphate dehydrogenase [Clostridiaceae bacterium]|jgi:glycerol-1-phosphate dehydrogenase [NAD(P)+]|nr:sn-glycerol-1-phosphate dehydrogenase [Clostridiaceae bacterium]
MDNKKVKDIKDIFSMSIEEMPGTVFECSCGRPHGVDIEKMIVRSGSVMEDVIETLMPYRDGKIFVLSDHNTNKALGKSVVERLIAEGFHLNPFTFEPGAHDLLPDESSIGRLLIEMDQDDSYILVVGSGVLNDIARIISFRTNKPYAIIGTAPSMDGYASVTSALVINGKKTSIPGKYPSAIFADLSVMRDAPMIMIQAGFGDVLGKITALADWQLSNALTGEYYCEAIAGLVQKAVDKCVESTGGLFNKDEHAIGCLIEALLLTGICIGLAGETRPASGMEHILAHYWDVKAIEAGREHPLHGNSVGVGTVITAMLYELVAELVPAGISYPSVAYVAGLLEKIGAPTSPAQLGISRELFLDSIKNAVHSRKKYTLLQLCYDNGRMDECAEILTRRLYD